MNHNINKQNHKNKQNYKQVILVRTDLKMGKGKLAAQVAHASVEAVLKAQRYKPELLRKWRSSGMKKAVLKVKNEDELLKYYNLARKKHLITALISDAGRTQLKPGTTTCLAIGPDSEEKINEVTGEVRLL